MPETANKQYQQWVLQDFDLLADYLIGNHKVEDDACRHDLAAFLLHAQHVRAYDFARPYVEGKNVLEVGCFIGYGSLNLAETATGVVSVDVDENALAFASSHRQRPNLRFATTRPDGLDFDDATFDVAVAFQVIEHVPPKQVRNFLAEIHRVLKPGGVFLATTPNRKTRLLPLQRPWNPEHFQEFSSGGFQATLTKVFPSVRISGVRAATWIEDIEKTRCKQCPLRVYLTGPLRRAASRLLPGAIKRRIRGRQARPPIAPRSGVPLEPLATMLGGFSMSDFYLAQDWAQIDQSLSLFAVCQKNAW